MIAVTGANGQLGRLVVRALLKSIAPSQVIATVRNRDKATELATAGVEVRLADYDRPEVLADDLRSDELAVGVHALAVGVAREGELADPGDDERVEDAQQNSEHHDADSRCDDVSSHGEYR